MSELEVRAAKRSTFQRFVKDPAVALLVLFLWILFRILPLDAASWVGGRLGVGFSYILRGKNRIALFNLQRCFPEKTDAERQKIAKDMWRHLGRMMGEMPHARKMQHRVQIIGQENAKALSCDGKGGFIASGHVGNWELVAPITLSLGFPIHVVYRAANNPWIEKFIFSHRRTKGVQLIPKGTHGAKMMIELLKKGERIGILCDQKLREGIDVPFFGHLAKTAPAIATLALKYDLPIVATRVVREKGAHYKCYFYPPFKVKNTGDKKADTYAVMFQINQILEGWIRERPEQWLWIHHRWDKSEYPKK